MEKNSEAPKPPKKHTSSSSPPSKRPVYFPPPPVSASRLPSVNPTADCYDISPNGVITEDTVCYWQEARRAVQGLPDLGCDQIASWTDLNSRKHYSVLNNAPKLMETNRMQWPGYLQDLRIFCIQFNIASSLFLELAKTRLYEGLRASVSNHVQQGFLKNEADMVKFLDTEIYSGLSYSVTREKFRRYNQQSRLEGHAFSKIASIVSQRQVNLLARLHPLATAGGNHRCDQATLQKMLLHDLLTESLTAQERAQLGSIGLLDCKDVDQLIKAQSTFSLFAGKQPPPPLAAPPPAPATPLLPSSLSNINENRDSGTAAFLDSLLNEVPAASPAPAPPHGQKKPEDSFIVANLKKEITALRRKLNAGATPHPPAPPPPSSPARNSSTTPGRPAPATTRRPRSGLCSTCRSTGVADNGQKCGHCYTCARDKGITSVWGQCTNDVCKSKYNTFLQKMAK